MVEASAVQRSQSIPLLSDNDLEDASVSSSISFIDWAEEGEKAMASLRRKLLCLGIFNYRLQRGRWLVLLSVLIFCVMGIAIPVLTIVFVQCPSSCQEDQQQPFQKLVRLSESTMSALSLGCLILLLCKHGLPQLLLLHDVFLYDSLQIQQGFVRNIKNVLPLLAKILVPFFLVELVHRVLWFVNASVYLPLISATTSEGRAMEKIIICCLSLAASAYNYSLFLLMCLLFKLMCSLQVLRLEAYYQLLESPETPSVWFILQEHMRLREQLLLISHRFRFFLVFSFFAITLIQVAILLKVTASGGVVNFERTGDLMVCCALQLVGFIICLHAAAKITHMAQRIVAIVSQWHAVATCADVDMDTTSNSELAPKVDGGVDGDSSSIVTQEVVDLPSSTHGSRRFQFQALNPLERTESGNDSDLIASLQLFHATKELLGSSSYSFHKCHALVTYLQHCNAGISVYGFALDRGFLYTIFGLELSLVLWILGKPLLST